MSDLFGKLQGSFGAQQIKATAGVRKTEDVSLGSNNNAVSAGFVEPEVTILGLAQQGNSAAAQIANLQAQLNSGALDPRNELSGGTLIGLTLLS